METHPVPQNITSFEFRLVGDMTLKQFMYLASGLGISYLFFVLLFPIYPYLAVPLIVVFTLFGIAFAFFPIAGRPLDHWVVAFFRAIYSPTKRFWISPVNKAVVNTADPLFKSRLEYFLLNNNHIPLPVPVQRFPTPATPTPPQPRPTLSRIVQPPPPPTPNVVHDSHLNELATMRQNSLGLQNKVEDLQKQLAYLKDYYNAHPQSQQTQAVAYAVQPAPRVPQPALPVIPATSPPSLPTIPQPAIIKPNAAPVIIEPPKPNVQIKMSLTSTPNVINGVVVDPERNYLEGVIIIIHNHEGLPVRALKTNKLGQFAGVTPLPNGIYTLNLEKEGFIFDTLQVTLNDVVLPPINVSAKRGA